MIGTIQLTPDQLAQVLEAVMGQNGMKMSALALYDSEGNLVGYDRAVITFDAGTLKVRSTPEDATSDPSGLRSILYPEVPSHAGFTRNGSGNSANG